MNKSVLRIFLIVQFMLIELFISGVCATSSAPSGSGVNQGSNGGTPIGASIDDGIGILLALGIAYGCFKIYEFWKKKRGVLKGEEQV